MNSDGDNVYTLLGKGGDLYNAKLQFVEKDTVVENSKSKNKNKENDRSSAKWIYPKKPIHEDAQSYLQIDKGYLFTTSRS